MDLSNIKINYSRMSDEQLINLAKTEGKELTQESLNILQEEFVSRNLDISPIDKLGEYRVAQQKWQVEKAHEDVSNEFMNAIWKYAFDEKKDGKSDSEIYQGLMERGMDEESASKILRMLESKAKEILDAHDSDMLRGGLVFLIGVVITFWTLSAAANGGTYVVAWGAIVFGAIRFFRGLSNKGTYKTILANIEADKEL